jgi:putative hydrolase of the HAD superfamily
MKKYSHLFFDLDRTLWDFEVNSHETFQELYVNFSLRMYFPDFYTFHQEFKVINDDLWEKYRQKQIEKEELSWKRFYLTLKQYRCDDKAFAHELGDYYVKQSPLKNKLFDGAIETLTVLKEDFKMFILTNGFEEVQFVKLKNSNLESYFDRVFTGEEIGVHKPASQFFEYVMNALSVKPENCLMIGDDFKTDIIGAQNCQIDQVYFNPQNTKHNNKPTFEIGNLKELQSILGCLKTN